MMRENLWKPSREAEGSAVFRELVGRVEEEMKQGCIDEINLDRSSVWFEDDFEEADNVPDEILSELHQIDTPGFTTEESRSITRLLSIEQPQWGYGVSSGKDQLLDFPAPIIREPTDDIGLKTLVGITGNDLTGASKTVDKLVERMAITPHQRRVLLGTVALIASSYQARRWEDYPGFANAHSDGISSRVEVYADFHGDFRMRETYQSDRILDPLGREQYGAPSIESNHVAGYHSVEPYLLMNVLVHQSKRMGKRLLQDFADGILKQIYDDRTLEVKAGPYADWGDENGSYEAGLLRELIVEGDASSINQLSVIPQGRERLVIDSTPEGILLCNKMQDAEGRGILVSNDKIEDFAATLIKSAFSHGRTAPGALLRILDVARSDANSPML
jgi:hypothetical protein